MTMDPPATPRDYYNAPSTHSFYKAFWGGGEHIHIGTYTSPSDTVELASQRTVERMAALVAPITPATRVLDVGAGYGGAARWLARTHGCKVTCLNLAETQNQQNRELNSQQGLDNLIEVVDGNLEHMPFANSSFDLVWCQDCLLHACDRKVAVAEIARVLVAKGAQVVLTDHMAAENADPEKLAPIKKRLTLTLDLATVQFYRDAFSENGFQDVDFIDGTEHMVAHGGKVLAALKDAEHCSIAGLDATSTEVSKKGMSYWIAGGSEGWLGWGIFHCRR